VCSDAGNNVLGILTMTQSDVSQPVVKLAGKLSGLTPGKHGLSVCVSGDVSAGSASCGPIFNPFGTWLALAGTRRRQQQREDAVATTAVDPADLVRRRRAFCLLWLRSLTRICYHPPFRALLETPSGKTHGAPDDDNQCMVGDLGNVVADENGAAEVKMELGGKEGKAGVQLLGPHSVVGRSIVLYAGEDDQGRGGQENSLATGNPGPRIAAGVIGLSVSSS